MTVIERMGVAMMSGWKSMTPHIPSSPPDRRAVAIAKEEIGSTANFRAPDMGAEIYATSGASYIRVSVVPGY
jgi:hypothetical protein